MNDFIKKSDEKLSENFSVDLNLADFYTPETQAISDFFGSILGGVAEKLGYIGIYELS